MLAAIAAAHRAGLVHRDVKPENVLVAEAPTGGRQPGRRVVKVADFGLARAVEATAEEGTATSCMAPWPYVAPELVTDGHADPRTDVYSAGIVLFEMLTGRVPYDGDRPSTSPGSTSTATCRPPRRWCRPATDARRRWWCGPPGGTRPRGPADAGALLAEVQAAREDVSALAGPTRALARPDRHRRR